MEKSNSNKEQPVNEGFSGKNISKNENIGTPELKTEFEKDAVGNVDEVKRARNVKENLEDAIPASKIDVSTKSIRQTTETAEHKDFNSNPNPKEFPDKAKKDQENRGNIED